MRPTIRIVASPAGLAELRADWDRLLATSPVVSGFHAPGWIEACWEGHDGSGRRLHVLVAEQAGQVVGILPTELSRSGELSFIGTGLSNYGGPIVAPDQAAPASAEWLAAIAADPQIRAVRLAGLRGGDPLLGALRGWQHPGWGPTRLVRMNVSPEVDLAGWAERFRTHKSHRQTVQRLEAFGELVFEETADPAMIRAILPDLFRFYQRRWSGRWVSGAFAERHRAFQLRAAGSGAELVSTLRFDGRIVAAALSLRAAGISAGYVLGYDDRLGPFSLGTVLIVRILRAAAERGDPLFDFSLGRSAYKLRWASSERPVFLAAAGRGSALLVARRRLWARARSVGWLRRAKVEGPRLVANLLGRTQQVANEPGIAAPASATGAWTIYAASGTEPTPVIERSILGFWQMAERFSPRLLEISVERRYRGDRAVAISRLGRELGVAWLAGPTRRAAIAAQVPAGDQVGDCWYQPIPTAGGSLADLIAALARPGAVVASPEAPPDPRLKVTGRVTFDGRDPATGGPDSD